MLFNLIAFSGPTSSIIYNLITVTYINISPDFHKVPSFSLGGRHVCQYKMELHEGIYIMKQTWHEIAYLIFIWEGKKKSLNKTHDSRTSQNFRLVPDPVDNLTNMNTYTNL
jgi:hypothetical protein